MRTKTIKPPLSTTQNNNIIDKSLKINKNKQNNNYSTTEIYSNINLPMNPTINIITITNNITKLKTTLSTNNPTTTTKLTTTNVNHNGHDKDQLTYNDNNQQNQLTGTTYNSTTNLHVNKQ